MHGWMGKILHIDLSSSKISKFSTQPYAEKYLGGRGIASRIYWETVKPEIGAFDSANHLIFMTGPLVATGAQGATRMSVVGKSPMAYPEKYCYGNIGGFFGAELKRAGFDGLVITGRASKPVYLWINNNHIELRDASSLWGNGAYRVAEMLQQSHGDRARFLTTGVAGENLVRSAIVFGSHQSTSTAGFGAVMASKNLKAVVVKGTGKPTVADPQRLKKLNKYAIQISKRLDLTIPPDTTASGHGYLLERIGKGGCYQCGLDCIRNKYRYGKRPDLEGYRRCQSMEYYMPWIYSREDEPVDTFFDAPTLANDYSICTFELRSMINWLYACYQTNSLTEEETGLPLSKIGTRDFLEKLLRSITYREGFGNLLAEGIARASEKVPEKARAILNPGVLPVGENDVNLPRSSVVHALLDPMEPRMSRPMVHGGFAKSAWMFNQMNPGLNPITTEVFRRIARDFWGSAAAADVSSYEGKALAAQKIQNRTYTEDSLGLCDFAWPLTYSFSKPDPVGDPDLEAEIFTAVTGVPGDEIDQCAERIANVQRIIMIREGRKIPEDDFPAEVNFTEPLKPTGPMMVPGPGDKPVSVAGKMLDRNKFTDMLREYYRLRGWDEATGIPRAETLSALGLDDMVPVSGFKETA
jgi:aldehyde:ferredoxin oxidoreductase